MDNELFSKVANIIAGQLDVSVEEVEPNATFIETLGADSLDVVELIMMIEETFDVEITDDAQEKIKTVQDLVNHLRELGK